MIIESVDLKDKEQIKKIINLIFRTFCECNKEDSSKKLKERYDKLYWKNSVYKDTLDHFKKSCDVFLIAKEDDKIIWVIRWSKEKIVNIYTDSNYQWKWIGKSLLNAFEVEAKKMWSQYIYLNPSKFAYNFYIKNWFSPKNEKYLEKYL